MITRRTLVFGAPALAAFGLAGCVSVEVTGGAAAARGSVVTGEALSALNALRAQNGLSPVRADAALGRVALAHSIVQAGSGRLSHRGFRARLAANGVSGNAAENVAMGQPDIGAVMTSWSGSRGHRRNMLGDFSRVGVAVARSPNSGNRPYWTMVLAE